MWDSGLNLDLDIVQICVEHRYIMLHKLHSLQTSSLILADMMHCAHVHLPARLAFPGTSNIFSIILPRLGTVFCPPDQEGNGSQDAVWPTEADPQRS